MKKILLLSFEMPPYVVGGIGTVAYEKIKGFSKLGYEVIVIAPKNEKEFDLSVEYYGIDVKNNAKKAMQMLYKAVKICKKEKIYFIYSLTGTYTGIVAYIINRIYSIPYFTMAHGNEFIRFSKNKVLKFIIKNIYEHSKRIFAVSQFTKNKLIEFGVEKKKIYVCYNGVDLSKYYRISPDEKIFFKNVLGIQQEKFILLTLARLDKRKNNMAVIKAIERLKQKNRTVYEKLQYIIGGKGKQYNELLNYIKDNKLSEKVKLLGYVDEKNINKLYNVSDLFVMPNIFLKEDGNVEGFGLVFLEAGAVGVPSIGGKDGGSAEAIVDNLTGYVINGLDIDELARKIEYLVENKKELLKLSEGALEKSKNYSWDKIIKNIDEEIKKN